MRMTLPDIFHSAPDLRWRFGNGSVLNRDRKRYRSVMSRTSSTLPDHAIARAGRPPLYSDTERRRRILQAAEQAFTTRGYGAATMEDVARTAGMSKKTIYAFYTDKSRLLAAIVVAADDCPWDDRDAVPIADPLAELRHRLMEVIAFVLSPRQVRLTRLLIAEAEHAPELADDFHERVMAKGYRYLVAAVERVKLERPCPSIGDVERVTGMLLGAAMGDLHLCALFGRSESLTRKRIVAQIDLALRTFGFIAE